MASAGCAAARAALPPAWRPRWWARRDAATLSTRAASFELTLSGVCNTAHLIRMESLNNGLWQLSETPPTRPEGFGTAVPYDLTARWTDQVVQISADAAIRENILPYVPIPLTDTTR